MPDNHHTPQADLTPSEGVAARVRMTAAGSPPSPGTPALEEQIAALAAQVRSLGQRLSNNRSKGAASTAETPPAPTPASDPRDTSPPITPRPAAPGSPAEPAPHIAATGARIVEMAHAAAAEIRADAEREAQRIRQAAAQARSDRVAAVLEIIARQCESVATLATEVDRIEQSAAVLREQLTALNDEWRRMLVAVSAVSRPDSGI
jgi:cell division septum initiation protein DivIVA